MKIIIIGAGIAGLSAYLSLKKHLLSDLNCQDIAIKIYEAYDISQPSLRPIDVTGKTSSDILTTWDIGSAIGITVNGLRVLKRLDGTGRMLNELIARGHPIEAWAMGTARGWKLMDVRLVDSSETEKKSDIVGEDDGGGYVPYQTVMIGRQQCWEVFRSEVVKDKGVVERRRVVDVIIGGAQNLNIVKFDDGTTEEADLVIGADGLRSVVRKAMFKRKTKGNAVDNPKNGKPTERKGWLSWLSQSPCPTEEQEKDYVTPHYEGALGVGGFVPSSLLESVNVKPGYMSIVLGPNGFFGHGYVTSIPDPAAEPPTSQNGNSQQKQQPLAPGPMAAWWSTFPSPNNPHPYRLSSSSPSTNPKPYEFDHTKAIKELQIRHANWKNPAIQKIISYVSDPKNFPHETLDATSQPLENPNPNSTKISSKAQKGGLDGTYPIYTTPELPDWQRNGRVVLIGDAAHALLPSSGQGASQALEDAETLGLFLSWFFRRFHEETMETGLSSITTINTINTTNDTTTTHHSNHSHSHDPTTQILLPALSAFTTLRIPRVAKIHAFSKKFSGMKHDMTFMMEMVMYLMIWLIPFLGDGGYNKREIEGYDLPGDVKRVLRERDGTQRERGRE